MEKRRAITEEDIILAELLIARSYGRLRHSVVRASSRTFSSVGGTIKKHPYAAAGAAGGAGIIQYGLFRLIHRNGCLRRSVVGGREHSSSPDMTMEIFSLIMPIIMPYITANLERYLGRTFSKGRN